MRAAAGGPSGELPCVWVTAGVLSYRPCDRNFECDRCPLYLALRRGPSGRADGGPESPAGTPDGARAPGAREASDDPVARYMLGLVSQCAVRLDRAYSADGLWMASLPSGELRIGLDDFTLGLLQPIDDLVLPRVGVWLRRGAPCVGINRGRLAIPLRCPVAGEVVAAHPRPPLTPADAEDPGADPWWFRLVPHESPAGAPGVLRHEALLGWYARRLQAVRDSLMAAMAESDAGAVGRALADGGAQEHNLEAVLGRTRYEELVAALFPAQA